MSDSTQPEVEGHPRIKLPQAEEVEGHRKHVRQSEDAEAPADEMAADESRDGSDPEVEGHKKHLRH